MVEINASNARQWSRLGSRGVFGQAVLSVAADHPELMVLSADLGNSSGLDRFKRSYPEQFLNTGIAEQNLVGVAAGLAKEGYNVFATSFAPFITMRAAEQIRMNLGYMGMNVKAVGIGSGVSMAFLGNSHYGLEDLAVMNAIPGLTVVCPADGAEIIRTVEAAADFEGPMYIRLTGAVNNPPVYEAPYDFQIGRAVPLRTGRDVTLVCHGSMVFESLEAAKYLGAQGIDAGVLNMHTLKPLDTAALDAVMAHSRALVTIEEHSVVGGLGSAVASHKASRWDAPPQMLLGLPDRFDLAGDYRYLLEHHGLTGPQLAQRIQAFLAQASAPACAHVA